MTTKKSTEKKKTSSSNFKKRIDNLKKNLKEKDEKLLRSYADIQNLQKRMGKEIRLAEEKTKEKYISELIDLKETLQKAILDDDPKEALGIIVEDNKIIEEVKKGFTIDGKVVKPSQVIVVKNNENKN